jgi:hypothetical protein
MRLNRTRVTMAPIIVVFCTALAACSWTSMPATVSKLQLSPNASITAASIGKDGRLYFAILRNGPGPGLGYIDEDGDVEITQLDPVAYGHGIGDLAIDAEHGVWATMPCYPYSTKCMAGFARFGGDYGPLTKIRALGGPDILPFGIAQAPDGSAWIAERGADAVVHVTLDDKRTVIRLRDVHFMPFNVQSDGKGGAYFVGPEPGRVIGVDRSGHDRVVVMPTKSSHASSMRIGRDGTIWLAEYDANKIAAIDPRGRATEYDVPTPNGGPAGLCIDSRGLVWFIERDGEKLGHIEPDGAVKDAYLPLAIGTPDYLEAMPNGSLVVVGHTKGLFSTSMTWAIARIPESTAGL